MSPRCPLGERAAKIIKILEIRDTRDYEEVGDRWIPIPGSGDARECDRCGRQHEVHVLVQLEDGTTAIVGTGCMEEASLCKEARSLAAKAKTRLQAERKRARLAEKQEEWDRAWAKILSLPLPEVQFGTNAEGKKVVRMGDTEVYIPGWKHDLKERVEAVTITWRRQRLVEMGVTVNRPY